MAITPAVLQGGALLGTAAAPLYTAPAATRVVIKKATFTNTTNATVNVTVSVTRAGGGATAIISAQPIGQNTTYQAAELTNHVLGPGDALVAAASAGASVGAVVSGFTQA